MKKSNIILLSALIVVLLSITISMIYIRSALYEEVEKGDGNIQKESRHVLPFKNLEVRGNLTVHFVQDTVTGLIVEADSNLLEHINTDVENDRMIISHNKGIRARNLKVHIMQEYLDEVKLNGGSRFLAEKPVKFGDIDLIANGGARFEIAGEFEKMNLELNAGSFARLSGQVKDFYISAIAGSNLKAKELIADNVEINATAGSNLEVYAVDRLSVTGSTGSNIYYHGEPRLENINTSTGANLSKR